MRIMKVLTVLSLVLAISGTAGAISIGTGDIKIKYENWDVGRLYDNGQPVATTEAQCDALLEDGAPQVLLPGSFQQSEDGWFVFRVTSIQPGAGGSNLWSDGNGGKELVGIGYGMRDVAAYVGPAGQTYIYGKGLTIDVYEQDHGQFDHTLGPNARINHTTYANIGTAGGAAGANLLVRLETIGADPDDPDAQIDMYVPSMPLINPQEDWEISWEFDGGTGQSMMFADATAGVWGDDNLGNGELVDGPFTDPVTRGTPFVTTDIAEAMIRARVEANPTNLDFSDKDDWYFISEDPINTTLAIPEPLTMVALFGSLAGLGGYIRKRRTA